MLILTYILVLFPSVPVLIFTTYGIGGWIGSVFLGIPYLISMVNSIRLVMQVALTDPGIIPKLKSSEINYNKTYNVLYRNTEELTKDDNISEGRNFFSLKQFKLSPEDTGASDDNHAEMLSFCKTCQIIRPPRSFHCGSCGVCIEVHDHHCPWVGTCVGRRNTRFFVAFLFWTGIHGLITAILCGIFFAVKSAEGKPLTLVNTVTFQ